MMKWDARNISAVEGQTEEIWFCARSIGPIRILSLFIVLAFLLSFISREVEGVSLGAANWVCFIMSFATLIVLSLVEQLRADGLSLIKIKRHGSQCICDLAEVTRIRKTDFGAFGYHFWVLEYRFTVKQIKKERFVPRKKGTAFETFLGQVKTANPSVIIQE